jgi:hypothetical protein
MTEASEARRFITEIIYPENIKTVAAKYDASSECPNSLINAYIKKPARKICAIMK